MAEIEKKDKLIKLEDFAAHMKELALAIDGQTSENASRLALLVVKAIEELENKIPKDYVDTKNIQTVGGKKTFTKPIIVKEGDYESSISTTWDGKLELKAPGDEVILKAGDGARVSGKNKTGRLYFGDSGDAYVNGEEGNITVAGASSIDFSSLGGFTVNKQAGASGQVLTSNGPGKMPTWKDASSGGGGDIDTSKFVTTDTDQEIGGHKTFHAGIETKVIDFKNNVTVSSQETDPTGEEGTFQVTAADAYIDLSSNSNNTTFAVNLHTDRKNDPYTVEYALSTKGFLIDGMSGTSGQVLVSNGWGKAPEWKTLSGGGDVVQSKYIYTCTGTEDDIGKIKTILNTNHGAGSFTLQLEGDLKATSYFMFSVPMFCNYTIDFGRVNITYTGSPVFIASEIGMGASLRITSLNCSTYEAIDDLFGIGTMYSDSSFYMDNCKILSNGGIGIFELPRSGGLVNINNCSIHCGDGKFIDEHTGVNLMISNNRIWCNTVDAVLFNGNLVLNNNIIHSNVPDKLFKHKLSGTYVDPRYTNICTAY